MSEPIRMVTEVQTKGVLYEVFSGAWPQWKKFVAFGAKRAERAGGYNFKRAAQEQQKCADSLVRLALGAVE